MKQNGQQPPIMAPRRLGLAMIISAAPMVLLLARLAVVGDVPVIEAVIAGVVTLCGIGLILWWYVVDVSAIIAHLDRDEQSGAELASPSKGSSVARMIIAEITRSKHAVRRQSAQLAMRLAADEDVLDSLRDPLILLDYGRRIVRGNGAAREIFGERMRGRDLAAVLRTPVLLEAVETVRQGGGAKSIEFTLPTPVERIFQARIAPFRQSPDPEVDNAVGSTKRQDEDLGPPTILLTLHDITSIRRSDQMRADFVANASHELRTPLTALLGFIETLRGPARDDAEARDRFLGMMHEQAGRMSRMVDDLLSLSRIEVNEHLPPTETVDVVRTIRAVVAALELRAAARRIRLRVETENEALLVVGDEDQLNQIFQNLLSNAIKYAQEQTEVMISLSVKEIGGRSMVCAAIADQGDGIAKVHIPRLTERFYRVDAARSRALGGTGLGLAIVKHILNRHRGRLLIESEVGQGSVFTILLPKETSQLLK
ncbi:two-component system, OmpR family, phosphate regulon sensor histidine kinase PhoR [Azospirillaceae bacterium]